jgi:hypothetical protein
MMGFKKYKNKRNCKGKKKKKALHPCPETKSASP